MIEVLKSFVLGLKIMQNIWYFLLVEIEDGIFVQRSNEKK